MLLEISGLTKYFGGLAAINELDMYVNEGEIAGLIGPNGAGKTTLFDLITGFLHPTRGRIMFEGKNITNIKPHLIAKMGIGRSFQLNPLFAEFTVLENLLASFHLHPKSSLWDAFFNTTSYRRNESQILEQALEILNMTGLYDIKDELAKNLPHGYRKVLGMARALAVRPKLLLLDEPVGGMSPGEISHTMVAIEKTRQKGVTVLLVEHNMKIMDLCDRVTVISFGRKIAEGSVKEVMDNDQVIEAYLGGRYAA
jgi:branched-chain amino acid transport system ATP-binding protein